MCLTRSAVIIDLDESTLPTASSANFSETDLIKGDSDLLSTDDLSNLPLAKATLGVTSNLSKKLTITSSTCCSGKTFKEYSTAFKSLPISLYAAWFVACSVSNCLFLPCRSILKSSSSCFFNSDILFLWKLVPAALNTYPGFLKLIKSLLLSSKEIIFSLLFIFTFTDLPEPLTLTTFLFTFLPASSKNSIESPATNFLGIGKSISPTSSLRLVTIFFSSGEYLFDFVGLILPCVGNNSSTSSTYIDGVTGLSGPKYLSPLSVNLYPSFLRLVFSIDFPNSLDLASKSFMYEFFGPINLVKPDVIAPPIIAA